MFNSTVLEVAIGLVFCYASVALIASSVYEAIASWLNLRSKTLFAGIKNLLNSPASAGNDLILKIYNNALAHPVGNGSAATLDELKNNPSHIDSNHFAIALIDAIQSAPNDFAQLGKDIDALPDSQIRKLLQGIYNRADGKATQLHTELATWFDASMEHISASYKRQAQTWSFAIAFVFAAVFNVDSIHLFSTLWQHPALIAQISMPASTPDAVAALKSLNELPIGWQTSLQPVTINGWLTTFMGWFITATAALFGAPFWYDLLGQLVRLRGAGPKSLPKAS
ncbi:MAG: hypothetical protein R8K20_02405 [Gallionellaceae bacterium]